MNRRTIPSLAAGSSTTLAMGSSTTLARTADHPRFLELTLGRLLELMVFSIEGVRDRLRRRASFH